MFKEILEEYGGSGRRDGLIQKFMRHSISDREVFELLLMNAFSEEEAPVLLGVLEEEFGSVHEILVAPMERLMSVEGMSFRKAMFVKLVYEMMLVDYKNYLRVNPVFSDTSKLSEYCLKLLGTKKTEEIHVFYLDAADRLLNDDLHSSGTVDWAALYPREIVKRALNLNAASVVLAHNHPGGGFRFSADDLKATEDLEVMLSLLGVKLKDHILVSSKSVRSLKGRFGLEAVA